MYSDVLKAKRDRYLECYNKVVIVTNNLAVAKKSLEFTIEKQKDSYRINDIPGGSQYLDHVLENENNLYNHIINNVLPNLKEVIESYNECIQDALIQESEMS